MSKNEVERTEKKPKKKPKKTVKPDMALNELQAQVLRLTKENDDLKKEMDAFKDQSLRALAELENVKRRKEQEKVDAIKFGNERLILALLPILDAFQLAMSQGDLSESNDVAAVVSGFEMIQKQLAQFLEKSGVVRIDAMDQPFDPNLHQGISQESHPDKDVNTIVKEMQPGYMLNDRVIRPAMVVVSTK
jgi:molecular chaperone GrpE